MPYVKLVEKNEHEGETWTFWLQIDGNEANLRRLCDVLAEYEEASDEASEYTLDLDVRLSDHDVDGLVEHGGGGYMAYHTKVTGVLTVPEGLLERTEYGPSLDRLYKGGIKGLFKEAS
jgi:hypothetical protein